jgi:hypothetical protein
MEDKTKENKAVINILTVLKAKAHWVTKLRKQKYVVMGMVEDWYEMPIQNQWEELNKELTKYNEIENLVNFLNKQT